MDSRALCGGAGALVDLGVAGGGRDSECLGPLAGATLDGFAVRTRPPRLDWGCHACFGLALAGLLLWRPVSVFPFLVLLLLILRQFEYPIGGYSQAEQILLGRVLMVFGGFYLGCCLRGPWTAAECVFLLCCLIAGHYWVCGLGKLHLNWLLNDQIHYLLPATYANGWLGFLEPNVIENLTRALAQANGPMKLLTVSVECGALLCLWHRSVLRLMLAAWMVFHAGIFLISGICFWKWMALDAAVLVIFFRRNVPPVPIFTRGHFLLSIGLIGTAGLWSAPVKLAWLDARVTYTYRFEAIGPDGRTFTLPPRFFAPYDYQFTLGNFGYITESPRLGIVWGAIMEPSLAKALEQAGSAEQVLTLEQERGRVAFEPTRSAVLDEFMRRFIGNWNRRGSKGAWWSRLQAPRQLWTFARPPAIGDGQSIDRVMVYEVTSLFDGERYREIRERRVAKIDL